MPTSLRTLLFIFLFVFLLTALVGYAQTALQFVPVTPCRVVDTRNAPGQFGGPPISGGSYRDFDIPQSACNIPSTAAAYSLNVAVVPHGGLGYLTVWPAGQPRPTIATLNSVDGRIKANAVIIPAGSSEAISVYATQTTDVVLDIDGYFVPATSATLAFFPLTPCRVADTRWTTGPLGGPYLTGGEERAFPILSSSCNIPDTAQAYSLNFAAIPHGPLGYMTVWPTGESKPLVSTLNALTGTITANAAIVPSGLSGAISVYPSSATDLVIDIDGYFAPADSAPDPLSLYALAPCRVLDTRQTTGAFSGTLPVSVLQSGCQVPSAQAYVLNATVVPLHGQPLGYLTLWPDAEDKPVVATLNALDGAITSNMAIVSTLNGFIDAYATSPTDLVVDIFSYFAPIGSLSIITTSLPSATLNYNYSTALGATGGVTPYAWSIISGSLPPGLNLDPTSGVISGTPTMVGTYPFTVRVSDSQSPPATASAPFSIAVNATLTQLSIVTTSLPSGTQNQTYSAMLAATGGLTPYTWSVTAGSLPRGLSLNSNTGAITGAPTGGGISNFTVQVADSESPPQTAMTQLSITITPAVPLRMTTTSLPYGIFGTPYSATLTAVGGVYPYIWTITAGSLPAGLSLNGSTGAITGTPTGGGTSSFTVQVADSETPPQTATAQLSITIANGILLISTNPQYLYLDNAQVVTVQVNGNGFEGGYQAQDCLGPFTLPPGVNQNQFTLAMGFDTPDWNPGWCDFLFTAPPSNTVSMAFLGNQNDLAVAPSGELFSLESGKGIVHKFKSDMTPDGGFNAGTNTMAMALDPKTGYITMTSYNTGLIGAFDENGNLVSGADGNYHPPQGVAIAADNGMACVVQATYVTLDCDPDITIVEGTIVSAPADFDPHNVAMATAAGNQEMAYVYARGTSTLLAYNVPQMTSVNVTPSLNLPKGTSNGFQLALLGTSVAAILDETNGTVVLVDLVHMIELHRATIQGGRSFRLAADPAHNAFLVAIADADNRLTHYASVDAGTGAVTQRASTSTLLSIGFGVASNGTISCMRDQCALIPNN